MFPINAAAAMTPRESDWGLLVPVFSFQWRLSCLSLSSIICNIGSMRLHVKNNPASSSCCFCWQKLSSVEEATQDTQLQQRGSGVRSGLYHSFGTVLFFFYPSLKLYVCKGTKMYLYKFLLSLCWRKHLTRRFTKRCFSPKVLVTFEM